MKYVFDKNGIVNSENTERLVQYSVNANILQVAFTDLNIKEYVPYVAFERADGKVSPLIGMAFTEFELSGTKYSGASYSFNDSWVTAQSGILKVAIILKKNNVNARTSTFNLNVAESISEDKVNYIDDVAYNELVGRVYQLEQTQQDIINGTLGVGNAYKALKDYEGNVIHETYETKIGATKKVDALKQKVENGEVIVYGAHRDGVGNNIVETYATKEENTENLDAAKEYADNKIVEIEKNINDNFATKEEIPKQTSQLNNDNGFITKLVDDLVNYYKKNEVLELINQIPKFSISKVEILPTENISETTIYLLRNESGDDKNYYIEYLYTRSGGWEVIGSTEVSLENFYNKEQINLLLDSKVDEETILSDGTIFKFEKIGDVYRIKHADTNGNILQYIDFDFDELIISNNDSKWTMDNDGMKFSKSYTIDGKKYEFTFENANNEIKLVVGTFIDNIYYIELGGITINEKGLSIQKLISLDNQSIDYINSIIDHAVLGIEENPSTLINGRWKFKETSITTNYGTKTFDVEFYDSVGNIFTQLENTLEGGTSSNRTNVFYGIKSNGEKILIYSNLYKTGLAYSEPNYFIVFNNEVDYLISRLTYFADKHIFKEVASKEYVDKAISNISGNADLSEYAKKSEIPTKISQLENDKNFVESTVNNLTNYYLKSETYTQDEIKALINSITSLSMQVVDILPVENISSTTIYLLSKNDSGESDVYDEYVYINNRWELIGNNKIDLNDYAKISDIPTKLLQLENEILIKDAPNLKGTWYLRESTITNEINDKLGYLNENINFTDSLNNKFINLKKDSISFKNGYWFPKLEGTLEDGTILTIYDSKDSLYNSVENYYLKFENEAVSNYVLIIFNNIGDKVDKVISENEVNNLLKIKANQTEIDSLIARITQLESNSGGVAKQVYAYDSEGNSYEVYGYDENGNKYLVLYEEVA